MSWTLLVPAGVGILIGLASGRLQRRLEPAHATTLLTSLAGVAAGAVLAAVLVVTTAFASALPFVAERVPWCHAVTHGHALPAGVGVGAGAAAAAMAVSVVRVLRRNGRHRRIGDDGPLVVLATDEPRAFAVPGDPGCVVVSAGMLRALDADERRVLLAHEHAHLRHHHHRYLWVADMAVAAVPLLRPLRARVHFATERWADEDAAEAVGDRRLVARSLCRAALAQDDFARRPAMSLADLGVPARVGALLGDPPVRTMRRRVVAPALGSLAIGAVVASSSVQLHHLATFATHFCLGL